MKRVNTQYLEMAINNKKIRFISPILKLAGDRYFIRAIEVNDEVNQVGLYSTLTEKEFKGLINN